MNADVFLAVASLASRKYVCIRRPGGTIVNGGSTVIIIIVIRR